MTIDTILSLFKFQSTHPRGGFNPRTRGGCDALTLTDARSPLMFQSTHPRGVRPDRCRPHVQLAGVSIHAPAGGATTMVDDPAAVAQGFNPRTRGGCDKALLFSFHQKMCFNPRTRGGCDEWRLHFIFFPLRFQSTHPRGVRLSSLFGSVRLPLCFNPRTRGGCDLRNLRAFFRRGVSIHAPAGGATMPLRPFPICSCCFNPRTRGGCDGIRH